MIRSHEVEQGKTGLLALTAGAVPSFHHGGGLVKCPAGPHHAAIFKDVKAQRAREARIPATMAFAMAAGGL